MASCPMELSVRAAFTLTSRFSSARPRLGPARRPARLHARRLRPSSRRRSSDRRASDRAGMASDPIRPEGVCSIQGDVGVLVVQELDECRHGIRPDLPQGVCSIQGEVGVLIVQELDQRRHGIRPDLPQSICGFQGDVGVLIPQELDEHRHGDRPDPPQSTCSSHGDVPAFSSRRASTVRRRASDPILARAISALHLALKFSSAAHR